MRVALFGGSFDPPHRGHAAIARAAADSFQLDVVLFTPTGRQPLKPHGSRADYADRMAMVSLVCAQDARFQLSGLDTPRSDHQPNYTVDTLEQIRITYPLPSQLFAIMGADSFLDFPKWYRSQRLLLLAEWIVISRPGFSLQPLRSTNFLKFANSVRSEPRMYFLETVHEDVSATAVRELLARGEDCSAFLLPEVSDYIKEHHLYQTFGDVVEGAE